MLVAAIVDIFKYLFNKLEQKISAQKKHHCYLNMSLQCDILIFIFIELEPIIQRPISYSSIRHAKMDQIQSEVWHPIPMSSTQPEK